MHLRKTNSQKTEISFDEPINTDWDGNELLLSDLLGTENDSVMREIEEDVDRTLLMQALEKLTDREKEIIVMRFGLGGIQEKTQKEVADLMGISQSYISRLEKRIILRLRREMSRFMGREGAPGLFCSAFAEGNLGASQELFCPAGRAFFAVGQRSKANSGAAPLRTR